MGEDSFALRRKVWSLESEIWLSYLPAKNSRMPRTLKLLPILTLRPSRVSFPSSAAIGKAWDGSMNSASTKAWSRPCSARSTLDGASGKTGKSMLSSRIGAPKRWRFFGGWTSCLVVAPVETLFTSTSSSKTDASASCSPLGTLIRVFCFLRSLFLRRYLLFALVFS